MDSLSANLTARSVVELSLNPQYSRHYSTLPHVIGDYYKSRGQSAEESTKVRYKINQIIQHTLCQNIGTTSAAEYHLFAIDVTSNQRVHSKKLTDKIFVHVNESVSGKKPVGIGHKYSCVSYLTGQKHWSLPLSLNRVPTTEKETTFGVKQWCEIIKDKQNEPLAIF